MHLRIYVYLLYLSTTEFVLFRYIPLFVSVGSGLGEGEMILVRVGAIVSVMRLLNGYCRLGNLGGVGINPSRRKLEEMSESIGHQGNERWRDRRKEERRVENKG